MLREIFGAKREEVRGGWKNCIVRSFMICAAEMGRALARGCVGVERCIQGFWWEVSREETN